MTLALYLLRASLSSTGLDATPYAYFNYLADAFLHGQLYLRLPIERTLDLVLHDGRVFLYWPPFPALVIAPLVAVFGVGVSDVLVTAVLGAISVALLARLLSALDQRGIAPLSTERRAILVATIAFGSVVLILAPAGGAWYTGQLVGWVGVLSATVVALTKDGRWGYFLVGLALACAMTTRLSLLFNGVWLAYYLLQLNRTESRRERITRASCGIAPVVVAAALLGWYNWARFGQPLEMGLNWHNVSPFFEADFARYGVFNLHYLGTNLYYQFIAYTVLTPDQALGGGLFWMTPVLLGAPYALWTTRRNILSWMLVLSATLVYVPIGLVMGTGFLTFGPRYLLDLMVPIVVLAALGIRKWRLDILQGLMIVSWMTYLVGSTTWLLWGLQF